MNPHGVFPTKFRDDSRPLSLQIHFSRSFLSPFLHPEMKMQAHGEICHKGPWNSRNLLLPTAQFYDIKRRFRIYANCKPQDYEAWDDDLNEKCHARVAIISLDVFFAKCQKLQRATITTTRMTLDNPEIRVVAEKMQKKYLLPLFDQGKINVSVRLHASIFIFLHNGKNKFR